MIELLAPLALLAVAIAYVRRGATLAARGQAVPWWRQLCFGLGLLILLVTDVPPVAGLAEELVVAHMAQHLLIGDLAALGIALGLTGPVLQPILRIRGLGWLRLLGNPLVALPLWILNLYLWHLAALYQGVLDSSRLHFAQHFGFLTLRGDHVVAGSRPAADPELVRQRREVDLRGRGPLLRRCARQHPDLVGLAALSGLRGDRGRARDLRPCRPGGGRRGDDGRGRSGHPRSLRLALLPLGPPGHRAPGATRPRRARRGGARSRASGASCSGGPR